MFLFYLLMVGLCGVWCLTLITIGGLEVFVIGCNPRPVTFQTAMDKK